MRKINKITTKTLCTIAMLLALSVVLGIFSLRIGSGIKISFKFIPVFITSALFGPLYGGICGALSDFLSYIINPAGGAYLPQISFVECLYGISFGLFFYRVSSLDKMSIIKLIVCLLINTVFLSFLLMSFILQDLMGMTFTQTLIYRLPATSINMIIHFICISFIIKEIKFIKRFTK